MRTSKVYEDTLAHNPNDGICKGRSAGSMTPYENNKVASPSVLTPLTVYKMVNYGIMSQTKLHT